MAKYRAIYQATWKDPDFQAYTPEGKLLFIYLCTNQSTSESGIYPISVKTISDETGIKVATVSQLLDNRLKNVVYDISNQFVYVRKFRVYNAGGRPDLIQKTIAGEYRLSKQTFLWSLFIKDYPEFEEAVKSISSPLEPPITNTISNTNTNTRAIEPLANVWPTVGQRLPPHSKKLYGIGKNVKLADDEYQKLIEKYGEAEVLKKIDLLSTYRDFKKYTDHYLTLNRWFIKDADEKNKSASIGQPKIRPQPQRVTARTEEYSMEEYYEGLR
jgi:hypothetical protein